MKDSKVGRIQNKHGYCYYELKQDYVHIYNLFVAFKQRRKGIARTIIQNAITEIRKLGYHGKIQIVAIPREDSISAKNLMEFYKKMGLEVFTYYGK